MTFHEYSHDGIVLRIQDINLAYGDKVILRGVNAEVKNVTRPGMQQGQVIALLGPSGVGKTQLFRRLAGLATPGATTSGRVLLGMEDTPVQPGLVGVVAQHYPLFNHRTVLGNLEVAGEQSGRTKEESAARAKELLTQFHLEAHAEHYPAELSGGQRQRVAIAQQLMCSEYFLLMDEPFSGLDPVMSDRVIKLIHQVSQVNEYNTTIVVTHDVAAAVSVADTIWIMGRDRDAQGTIIPGAYIKHQYDLAAMGLAWRPDIRRLPQFSPLVNEIREAFTTL